MGFKVLNANGQIKQTVSPIISLPLDYTDGGLGITGYNQAELLYGLSSSAWSRIPIKINSTGIMEFLCNNGTIIFTEPSTTPIWTPMAGIFPAYARVADRLSGLRKFGFTTTKIANTTTMDTIGANSITLSGGGGVTRVTDTITSWLRALTTAVANNSISIGSNGLWQTQIPSYLEIKLRTGPDITNMRWFFGIISGSFSNADDNSTIKGYGFRYSTAAGDTSFVPWYANGNAGSQFIGSSVGSIAPSTIYTIGIGVDGDGQCYFIINGIFVTFLIPSISFVNLALVSSLFTLSAAAKQLDVTSISLEWS